MKKIFSNISPIQIITLLVLFVALVFITLNLRNLQKATDYNYSALTNIQEQLKAIESQTSNLSSESSFIPSGDDTDDSSSETSPELVKACGESPSSEATKEIKDKYSKCLLIYMSKYIDPSDL